ncbi:MAG TPA: hypothetical protein VL025_11805 [Thermoanaerobaculia bacterium]|nr:hypothetical protein [Thermoanaerobaculia bacterium]
MRPPHCFLALSFAFLAAACGARSTVQEAEPADPPTDPSTDPPTQPTTAPPTKPPPPPPLPALLYVGDGAGCAIELPPDEAADIFAWADPGGSTAVVEAFFADECTGAGGQYVLAREVDSFRRFWLGAHACYFFGFPPPDGLPFGVVRYTQTAGIFEISPDVCVGFPDEPPGVQTDTTTAAIALFESLDEANAFAAAVDPSP